MVVELIPLHCGSSNRRQPKRSNFSRLKKSHNGSTLPAVLTPPASHAPRAKTLFPPRHGKAARQIFQPPTRQSAGRRRHRGYRRTDGREVGQHRQPRRLALFRVELHAHRRPLLDGGGERLAVVRRRGDDPAILGVGIEGMHEVHVVPVLQPLPEPGGGLGELERIPADLRHFQPRARKRRTAPGNLPKPATPGDSSLDSNRSW